MCTVNTRCTALDEYIRAELEDYEVLVVNLESELSELAAALITELVPVVTFVYNECFTRCSEEFSSYRELIFHGTNYEYNLSVLFSESRFTTTQLMMVGLFSGNNVENNKKAVLCIY